jgi:putative ABC transport system permease protein
MRRLLLTFSWQELRHHPWRSAAAMVAVMLGVALAFSVHLINASALSEFASAVRAVNGQPDLELRAAQGGFDDALLERVATLPGVALASPVLELQTLARRADGTRVPLRVLGVDALLIARIAPGLMPRPDEALAAGRERLSVLLPDTVFLNATARALRGDDERLTLQAAGNWQALRVAGDVTAPGEALAVMDVAAAQERFDQLGRLTRIDLRLAEGADARALRAGLAAIAGPGVLLAEPASAGERASNLSRAYRVNLTVLALVALFTGAFLVFSVLSLSVTQRQQQFALLGVLGLSARERLRLVLAESLLLGVLGSGAGLLLGALLAGLALRLLGGDLGGGFFQGQAPALSISPLAALLYGALGVVAALVGGFWPARAAQHLPPAQALKGLGLLGARGTEGFTRRVGLGLMVVGLLLAFAPPVAGVPVAAYLSVAALLVGGIVALPVLVSLVYDRVAPRVRQPLPLLAVERARRMRSVAAVAVSGVVASLALSVALTVMVTSFRQSVMQWLDGVLPAQLYLRGAPTTAMGDAVYFERDFLDAVARIPGVQRVSGQRHRPVLLDPAQPAILLLVRALPRAPLEVARQLPLVGDPVAVGDDAVPVYVSEAMVDLHGARVGQPLPALAALLPGQPRLVVAGVWRDYARQGGSVVMAESDWRRLSDDTRVNDLSLWLDAGADEAAVRAALAQLAAQRLGGPSPEIASAAEIRAHSLRIFDRSFAVTYWLQAVAIGIGLFGVAASFSAQVLARRKEFGLLAHLGLTRAQVLAVVTGEGAAWTLIGAAAGLGLGLAVSVVLVHVVNPQSFHWTMELRLPLPRLLMLALAVVVAGTVTAWLSGRAAASRDAVLAVKEDW